MRSWVSKVFGLDLCVGRRTLPDHAAPAGAEPQPLVAGASPDASTPQDVDANYSMEITAVSTAGQKIPATPRNRRFSRGEAGAAGADAEVRSKGDSHA